jgi:Fe-S-cluster-containing hydrogenase component 2
MAYAIAAPCVDHMDRSCLDVCPVGAISGQDGVDRKLYVDPDDCIDCGICETTCPNGAIYQVESLPAEWAGFAWTDTVWYRDMGAARAAVDELVPRSVAG